MFLWALPHLMIKIHPLLPWKKSSKNKYLLARAQTYSHYKSHNTVQVLIGITLQGSVCFVSKAWVLNIEHCGMLKNVRPGDLVMADRGFTMEENLSLYQAKLAILAFSKGKSQSDPVSVERVIGLLRQKYSVFLTILSIDYLLCSDKQGNRCCPLVDRLIRVCCALISLCPSVVPFDWKIYILIGPLFHLGVVSTFF